MIERKEWLEGALMRDFMREAMSETDFILSSSLRKEDNLDFTIEKDKNTLSLHIWSKRPDGFPEDLLSTTYFQYDSSSDGEFGKVTHYYESVMDCHEEKRTYLISSDINNPHKLAIFPPSTSQIEHDRGVAFLKVWKDTVKELINKALEHMING